MPRRGFIVKREIIPDPKYHDRLVAKFINKVMMRGKKSVAESIVYGAFDVIKERAKTEPLDLFKNALGNVKPVLETKTRRVGGSNYQIPVEVRSDRRVSLGMRWLINFARKRVEKSMKEKLAAELIDAANNRGASVKKKEEVHKMAEANKAFAHYRW
jgi:small subunit ribosomal protein S7